jgi:hypothetical protein
VARILGVRSKSAAARVLQNRVYLGEARSGRHVREGAHEPLVDEVLFARVQRRQETVVGDTSKPVTLLAKVLKCGSCGGTLTWDGSMAKPGYRCKQLHCERKVAVAAEKIEPVVVELALGWHAVNQPWFALTRKLEDAMLPARMDALQAARAEVESLRDQIESGAISPTAGAVALTAAEKAVEQARELVESAEAGTGWLALPPQRVAEKLGLRKETVVETKPLLLGPHLGAGVHEPAGEGETFETEVERVVGWDADTETMRSFIREMGTVHVHPVGRGHGNLPVTSRIRWQPNTPVVDYTALPEGVLEAERAEFLAAVEAYRALTPA